MPRFRWRSPYGRRDERDRDQLGVSELGADTNERLLRDQVRLHELEEGGPLLEHLEQTPVPAKVVRLKLIEETRCPPHVEALLARLEKLGERRQELHEECPLAARELLVLESITQEARTELESGDALVQVLAGPLGEAGIDRVGEREETLRSPRRST